MNARTKRKAARPLDSQSLRELALRYVGRYATSKAKLVAYLTRKIRERGWAEDTVADLEALVGQFAEMGYVDDEAFALAKSRALIGRGYGPARLRQHMRSAGIGEEDGEAARALAESQAAEAALRFARRKRIGPYAERRAEGAEREKAMAMLIRAGHRYDLARDIVNRKPGDFPSAEELAGSPPTC